MLAAELSGERRWNLVYAARTRIRKNYAATLGEPIRREAAAEPAFPLTTRRPHQDRNEPTLRWNDGYSHSRHLINVLRSGHRTASHFTT